MTIPTNIDEQLRRDEGVRPFPYVDTKGKITIGIGRNLTAKGISPAIIEEMYREDFAETQILNSRLPWFRNIDPIRQAVFENMAFNLGFVGLEKFENLLRFAARGDWEYAAAEILSSEWSGQVHDRSVRCAQQLKTGEWV